MSNNEICEGQGTGRDGMRIKIGSGIGMREGIKQMHQAFTQSHIKQGFKALTQWGIKQMYQAITR